MSVRIFFFLNIYIFSASQVKQKFSIPSDSEIHVLDDTGTEVDEDVFCDVLDVKPDTVFMVKDIIDCKC